MHPIFAQPRRLALYLFVFLQAGLLLGELLVRTAGAPRPQAMALAVPLLLLHSFSCLASWYLCRSMPLGGPHAERLVVTQLAAAALASGLITVIGAAWARGLDGLARFEGGVSFYPGSVTLVFVFALLVYSLSVAVHYLFIASEASRAAARRAYELRLAAQEAELKALKAQIDPHFLFNSLNSISGLVSGEPEQARATCVALAGFLRQSLRMDALTHVPLADELALAESYLAVEQVRFGDRLQVELSHDEDCLHCEVPPLILQPLVENAVRHGVAHLLEGGTVGVAASASGSRLRLEVTNRCDPDRPRTAGKGIGLDNVRRRLDASFGQDASLKILEETDRFQATVTLPAHRAPEQLETRRSDEPAKVEAAADGRPASREPSSPAALPAASLTGAESA